jgi:hypothetical protein
MELIEDRGLVTFNLVRRVVRVVRMGEGGRRKGLRIMSSSGFHYYRIEPLGSAIREFIH